MVPYGVKEKLKKIKSGEFTVEDVVCVVETENGDKELTMMQKIPGPPRTSVSEETAAEDAACNGTACHRYIFPVSQKAGAGAVPGPFGSGKTVIQHQLASGKADIVVYIGCGERGNEMTDVLNEFPELKDPKTGQSLMQRRF